MSKPKVIDLFCGAGGFSEGFSRAGFEVLAGADTDEKALKSFEQNHDAEGYQIDLSKVEPSELLTEMNISNQSIDGIIGGPPCQGFSQAGKRNPDDDRNNRVINYFDIIDELEPRFFVMENVRAITYERNKETIEYIKNRISSLDYNRTIGVLNAADFGVAQTRKRLFIIGCKDAEPTLPEPTHEDNWVGLNEVIEVPDGQIVSSYGTQETLRGKRNTRDVEQPSYTLRATRCLVDIIPNDYQPPEDSEEIPSISDVRIYRFDEDDAARVQSFPDDYKFTGNKTEVRSQIGNAVPPLVAERIGEKVRELVFS